MLWTVAVVLLLLWVLGLVSATTMGARRTADENFRRLSALMPLCSTCQFASRLLRREVRRRTPAHHAHGVGRGS